MEYALILVVALVLDAALGEPAWLWSRAPHPRVLMINLCGWLRDAMLGRFEPRLPGGIALAALVIGAGALGWALSALSLFGVVEVAAAAILIGFRDVLDRLGGVEHGLAVGPEEAAHALARVARRNLAPTTEDMTARIAMELSSAHFVDRFVAPVFWFLLFGLPGLCIVYVVDVARQVLAQDEAEGEGFGWAARRLDELIKWIPGRIAGWALVVAALPCSAWEVMMEDAAIHRSAYAGWPIAAAAAALDVALGGPRPDDGVAAPYINRHGRRELTGRDLGGLAGLLWRGWMVALGFLVLLALPVLLF
jgi:adenosylcobinamide-phosphate synthase